jgi:hypothetical protein
MTDLAKLVVEVDTSNVKLSAQELKLFESVAKRTGETVDQVATRFKGISSGAVKLQQEVEDAAAKLSKFSNNAHAGSTFSAHFARALLAIVPVGSVFGLAMTAASLAVEQLLTNGNRVGDLKMILEAHSRLLDTIKDSYRGAADEAGRFYRESREVLLLQTQQNLLQQRTSLQSQSRSILNITTGPSPGKTLTGRENLISIDRELLPFRTAIEALNRSAAAGNPDIIAYREEIARIGLAAAQSNPKLAAQANTLLTASNDAGDMARKIQQAEAMLALLNGTATKTQREMLGLSTQAKATTSAYESLVQRTKDRIEELRLEAAVVGQSGEAVLKLKLAHELERAAKRSSIPITREMREEWKLLGDEAERASQTLSSTRLLSDLAFERAQVGRTDIEQQIASTLRQAGNIDPASISGQLIANQVRLNEELKRSKELANDFASTFSSELRSALRDGQSFWEAFGNAGMKALQRVADKLMDMAVQDLVSKAFGGTNLFSLFGSFGSSGAVDPWAGLRMADGGVFSHGNVIPFARGAAFTNSVVTKPTLFPFANGTGLMGEAGPEAIMPLRRLPSGRLGVEAQGGNRPSEQTVRVIVESNDDKLRVFVRGEADTAVSAGIDNFDRALPDRMNQIENSPRRRRSTAA